MLEKLNRFAVAFLAALTLALTPAQDAAAWERVCMKLPLWKTWFSTHFYVAYDFPASRARKVPAWWREERGVSRLPGASKGFGAAGLARWQPNNYARGVKKSSNISANRSACVDIGDIPNGQRFFVYIAPDLDNIAHVCATHPSNRNPWYEQQNRGYRNLNYEAWGVVWDPKCEFKYEN